MTPDWIIPVLTLLTGYLGGYLGASRKVIVLETRMEDVLKWKKSATKELAQQNEDLLIHDTEIGRLCEKAGIPRARRQSLRQEVDE